MYKKTVEYENYDGEFVTQDLYFNMTAVEVSRFAAKYGRETGQDFTDYMLSVIAKGDVFQSVALIGDLVLEAYGRRVDSNRFSKRKDIKDEFVESPAFDAFVDLIMMDEQTSTDFAKNVLASSKMAQRNLQEGIKAGGIQTNGLSISTETLEKLTADEQTPAPVAEGVSEDADLKSEFEAFLAQRNANK